MNSFIHYLDQWIGRLHHLRRNYNQTVPLNEQIRHTKEKIFFEVVRRCIERMNRKVPEELCFQFRTNRGDLSRKIDISESAVYRGLKVLEKAGFIQIFSKGRELGFDIFVNPQIFFDFKQEHPYYLDWNEVDKSVENYLTDEPMIQVSLGFNLILFKNLACFMSERPHKNISSKLVNNESEKWTSSSNQEDITHLKQKKGIHIV